MMPSRYGAPLGIILGTLAFPQSMPRDQQTRDFMSRFTVNGEAQIDGYGAASNAVITLSCGGTARADSHGKFVLGGVVGAGGKQDCEVVVQAPGCESRSVPLVGPAGTVSVGVVKLVPLIGQSGSGMISFWSLATPPQSLKLRQAARKNLEKKKLKEAETLLRQAIAQYERDPEAWFELGMVHKQTGDAASAVKAFERASAIDEKFVPPLVQLATLALRAQDWDAVAGTARRVTTVNPIDFPEAWLYLATALVKQGDPAGAEIAARKAAAGPKGLAKAHHILGVALAGQRRYTEAIEELRTYLRETPAAPDAGMVREHLKLLEAEGAKP